MRAAGEVAESQKRTGQYHTHALMMTQTFHVLALIRWTWPTHSTYSQARRRRTTPQHQRFGQWPAALCTSPDHTSGYHVSRALGAI